jgi:hypothetical protein
MSNLAMIIYNSNMNSKLADDTGNTVIWQIVNAG